MFSKFLKDESGQGMVEYVLIVALIAIVVIGVVKIFGKQILNLFKDSSTKIEGATGVSGN